MSPPIETETCGCTGTGKAEFALSVVLGKVKSTNGTCGGDLCSSASFCTEELMLELGGTGKKTNLLLCTTGQERPVSAHVVAGLEISGLDEDVYVTLPQVLSQKEIPGQKE